MSDTKKNFIQVRLKTDGNDIIFHLIPTSYSEQVEVYITIENQPTVGQYKIESIEEIVEHRQLIALCEYLLAHIEKIKTDPDSESYEYQDHTMLYIVKTSIGSWYEEDYATFHLTFLVNIGRSDTRKRVWMGSETRVDSREIIDFCKRIRSQLAQFNAG